jgi:pimeloyl-ACP methyl ester carboxylesterase
LLHEGLGCVALWRDFPQKLAAATGLGVVVYSRFGYGASDAIRLPRPLDYMTRKAVEVLPQFLDAVGFRGGALIGHSDGATISLIHAGAVRNPRIQGLALIAPHLFAEPEGLASIAEAREAYEQGDLKAKLARYHRDVDIAFRGWCDAWLDPAFRTWNVAGYVDSWRTPALAIQGAEDQYGTLAQIREIERRAPTRVETLILPGCKHQPHLERTEEAVAAVAKFLRSVLTF